MKSIRVVLLLSLFSILFMGCPYGTEVPLDIAAIKVDQKLVGKWESKSSTSDSYIVTKADEAIYAIQRKSNASTDVSNYKAYASEISGTKFLNLWEETASPKVYYLYKFVLSASGSKVTLIPVTENIDEKFTTSAELKKFVQTHMGLSFFYSKEEDEYFRAD